MILVDTSVWIDHFRSGESHLQVLLESGSVLMHPFVIGELACGNLKSRRDTLSLLQNLPPAHEATNSEAITFIESNKLMGKGIGWIDAHLLASAALGADTGIWSNDTRLAEVAGKLRLQYTPEAG